MFNLFLFWAFVYSSFLYHFHYNFLLSIVQFIVLNLHNVFLYCINPSSYIFFLFTSYLLYFFYLCTYFNQCTRCTFISSNMPGFPYFRYFVHTLCFSCFWSTINSFKLLVSYLYIFSCLFFIQNHFSIYSRFCSLRIFSNFVSF